MQPAEMPRVPASQQGTVGGDERHQDEVRSFTKQLLMSPMPHAFYMLISIMNHLKTMRRILKTCMGSGLVRSEQIFQIFFYKASTLVNLKWIS